MEVEAALVMQAGSFPISARTMGVAVIVVANPHNKRGLVATSNLEC